MTGSASDCCTPTPGMVSMADALQRLQARASPRVGTECLPLGQAAGRVLAAPLVSLRDVPAFDNVAVDGYAFASIDLLPDRPTVLKLRPGRAAAGHPFAGSLRRGEAVQAMTGAMLPAGADRVAMWEEVELGDGQITIFPGRRSTANRRRAGEDIRAGQRLFQSGLRLQPQHIGVAAELGLAELLVFRRLRVALLSSGDELREPGCDLPPGGVFDANRYILGALLARLPAEVTDLGILPDDAALTAAALQAAATDHDLIVASGGASRGETDQVVRTVAAQGQLDFWSIAMKPGRPLAIGELAGAAFVGLPGNPVATTVCFLLFARPLILRLAGAEWWAPRRMPVPAGFTMQKRPGRTELLRATLVPDEQGRLAARRILREGSGILTSLTDADGLVEIGEAVTRIELGDPVPFMSFAELGAGA